MGNRDKRVWYVHADGQQFGPFTQEERDRIARREIAPETLRQASTATLRTRSTDEAASYQSRDPIQYGRDLVDLLTSPSDFSRRYIHPDATSTRRSFGFFFSAFAVSFTIFLALSFLENFSGASETRHFTSVLIRIAIVFLPLYLAARLIENTLTVHELLQCIFYADGAFVLFSTLTGAAIGLAERILIPGGMRLVDILGTEQEACFAANSTAYWLIRGELTFYLNAGDSVTVGAFETIRNYSDFVVFIPFVFVFGWLLGTRYARSGWLFAFIGALAFVLAETSYSALEEQYRSWLVSDSPCWSTTPTKLVARYKEDELIQQLDVKLRDDLRRDHGNTYAFGNLTRIKNAYLVPLSSKYFALPDRNKEIEKSMLQTMYCKVDVSYSVARKLGYGFGLVGLNERSEITQVVSIGPSDCSTSGN